MAKIALSDNAVVGPTAGRAGSQACGGRVRPTLTGRPWPVKQEPIDVLNSDPDPVAENLFFRLLDRLGVVPL
jgi:hypothetical protein